MSEPEAVRPVTAAQPAAQPAARPAARPEKAPAPEPAAHTKGAEPGRRVVAEIYITPLGTGEASIADTIRALRPLLDASGLRYEQHALGTVVEGPLVHVLELTRALHDFSFRAGKGAPRVVTHLRIDERRDGDPGL